MTPRPRRFALSLAMALLSAACSPPQATPGVALGGRSAAGRVTARAHLAVRDPGGRRVLADQAITPWGPGDIDHVTLAVATQAAPAATLAVLLVTHADLASNALSFTNLERDTGYVIEARAFRLPRDGNQDEQPDSEIDDAAAHPTTCEARFGTGEAEDQDLGALPLQLVDKAFSGQGTARGIVVTDGTLTHDGDLGGAFVVPSARGDVTTLSFSGVTLSGPRDLVRDSVGNLYVADVGNHRICKITPQGVGSALALTGVAIGTLTGLAIDKNDVLYGSDTTSGVYSFATSGGAAAIIDATPIADARGLAVDAQGHVFVATAGAVGLYKLVGGSPTAFGTGVPACGAVAVGPGDAVYALTTAGAALEIASDGSTAPYATGLGGMGGGAFDAGGYLYVSDGLGRKVRKVAPGGAVSALAGSGEAAMQDGLGAAAKFDSPAGIACDRAHRILYVADAVDNAIRVIR